jgi:4,5-dihydroxyphthalate decarboxylase
VGWLFADPRAAAIDYYRKTRIFPIMHIVGIRCELAVSHPWLPATILKAFTEAKRVCIERLADTSATKVTLPFVEEQLQDVKRLPAPDFGSYGYGANRHVLEAFLHHHHRQGLSVRQVRPDELFHASTFETAVV